MVVKNGRRFKEFTIIKGQTLYSLSKVTGVPQDSLIAFNKGLENGLKIGMRVCIPIPDEGKLKTPNSKNANVKHVVKPGETIFGIARMYGLTQDELISQNPSIKTGLITGSIILIYPKPSSPVVSNQTYEQYDEKPKSNSVEGCNFSDSFVRTTIKVSLILPLYSTKDDNQLKSRTGLEFYAGCMLALDSLKKRGLQIELHVFDTQSDSLAMNKILKSKELAASDFVLGPLHASEFRNVNNFLSRNKTVCIAPLASSSALISGAPNAVKLIPDQKKLMEGLAEQVVKNYRNARYVFIRNSNVKDKDHTNALASALATTLDTTQANFVSIAYSGVNDLLEKLDSDRENVLFFPSTAQVQVIDAIARLNASRLGKRITLVGLNEWNSFENIEYEHLNNLNFTYAAPWYLNYTSREAKKFRSLYRNEFKGEPGIYAFQGFDAMLYFVEASAQMHTLNSECLTVIPSYKGLCTEFKFKKENGSSGAQNMHVYVLQLSDYLAAPINKP